MGKIFLATCTSFKGKHPNGLVVENVVVKATFKKDGVIAAQKELEFWDVENHDKYQKPSLIECGEEELALYLQRKEDAGQCSITEQEESNLSAVIDKAAAEAHKFAPSDDVPYVTIDITGNNDYYMVSLKEAGEKYTSSFQCGKESKIQAGGIRNFFDKEFNEPENAITWALGHVAKWMLNTGRADLISSLGFAEASPVQWFLDNHKTQGGYLIIKSEKNDSFIGNEIEQFNGGKNEQSSEMGNNGVERKTEEADNKEKVINIDEKHVQRTNESDGDSNPSMDSSNHDAFTIRLNELNEDLKTIKPGEVRKIEVLENKLYHACNGYSSSNIKDELISSMFRHGIETGEIESIQAMHLDFGNYLHTLLLQPELIDVEYIFEPIIPDNALSGSRGMKAAIEKYNASIEPSTSTDELKEIITEHNKTIPAKLTTSGSVEEIEFLYNSMPEKFKCLEAEEKPTAANFKKHIKRFNDQLPLRLKTSGGRDELISLIESFDPHFAITERAKKPTLPLNGTIEELAARVRSFAPDTIFEHELVNEYRTSVSESDLIGITQDQKTLAQRIRKAALSDKQSKNFLLRPGQCEESYFWIDGSTGLLMKCRPDKRINNVLIDLKSIEIRRTVKKCDLKAYLIKEIEQRGYHISAAHYLEGTGTDCFVWVFVNKLKGYEFSAVVLATPEMLELGEYELRDGISSLNESEKTKVYPSPIEYDADENGRAQPIEATPSGYAMHKLEFILLSHF